MIFPLLQRKLIRGFQAHIDAGLSGATDYVADYESLYSPVYATVYLFGSETDEGGYWIGLKCEDGTKLEFAHLSERLVKDGDKVVPNQKIGITGNSGTITSGPHLHCQVLDASGSRLDPEKYFFAVNIPIVALNTTVEALTALQSLLLSYSAGMLTISWDIINHPISVLSGMFTQDHAYDLAKLLNVGGQYDPYRYLFFFYDGNATSTFLASFSDPALDASITTAPLGSSARLLVFELAHQLAEFYNAHRGSNAYLNIIDSNYPTDDLIINKLRSVLPYTALLLEHN